jgi:hypothetical protein
VHRLCSSRRALRRTAARLSVAARRRDLQVRRAVLDSTVCRDCAPSTHPCASVVIACRSKRAISDVVQEWEARVADVSSRCAAEVQELRLQVQQVADIKDETIATTKKTHEREVQLRHLAHRCCCCRAVVS